MHHVLLENVATDNSINTIVQMQSSLNKKKTF